MSIQDLLSQEEIDACRRFFQRQKEKEQPKSPNSDLSIICLGILDDAERLLKQTQTLKNGEAATQ
jgi:hypothetical protein